MTRQGVAVRTMYDVLGLTRHAAPSEVLDAYHRRLAECESAVTLALTEESAAKARRELELVETAGDALTVAESRTAYDRQLDEVEIMRFSAVGDSPESVGPIPKTVWDYLYYVAIALAVAGAAMMWWAQKM